MAERRRGRALLAGGVCAALAGMQGCSAAPRPNVLLVTIDTLRSDHTSAYGYARDTTPNLRALAYAGARFERAYAPTSTTAPSHASIFTGLYPVTHRVVKNGIALGEGQPTLAQRFAAAGYQTAAVVSSYPLRGHFGFARGFEVYQDDFRAETSTLRSFGPTSFDRRAEETTDRALRWLREGRDAARPFLLFVHYFDPHSPYGPPWPFDERFGEGTDLGLIENQVRLYDGEIAYADAQLGRLLEGLEQAGLAGGTLVVVTADHGEGLMDHGHLQHGLQIYEEAVRVPLLVRWPGQLPAGRSVADPVELVDLAPTLLELAGVPFPREDFPGESLAPALRDGAGLDAERPIYLYRRHYNAGNVTGFDVAGEGHGVVEGGWKYIETGEGGVELYDLARDPGERVNRASVEAERAERLRARLADFRRAHERAGDVPRIGEEDRGALEALGYVE